jgi:hypothetical protein
LLLTRQRLFWFASAVSSSPTLCLPLLHYTLPDSPALLPVFSILLPLETAKMLKLWSLKQQQQKDEAAQGPAQKKKKVTAAQLRVQKGGWQHAQRCPY